MVRPFIFPALTIWGTRGTLVLRLSGRQPFFRCIDSAGCTNRVSVFAPNGRGCSLNPSGGSCALRSAGIRGARRGGKKEGQPAVFLPL